MTRRSKVLLLLVLGALIGVTAWVVDSGEAAGKAPNSKPAIQRGDYDPDPGGHGGGPPP